MKKLFSSRAMASLKVKATVFSPGSIVEPDEGSEDVSVGPTDNPPAEKENVVASRD